MSSARPRPTQARARRTVQRILDAARTVLERDGPQGFTTNHVAAEAGIAVGTLYGHFARKEHIAEALVSELADAEAAVLLQALEGVWEAPIDQVVDAVVRTVYRLYRADGAAIRAAWAVMPLERRWGERPRELELMATVDRWLDGRGLRQGPRDALLLFHVVEALSDRLAASPLPEDDAVQLIARAVRGVLGDEP